MRDLRVLIVRGLGRFWGVNNLQSLLYNETLVDRCKLGCFSLHSQHFILFYFTFFLSSFFCSCFFFFAPFCFSVQLATSAETDSEVRSEAFWVVLNATSCGSDAQVNALLVNNDEYAANLL